MKTVDQRAVLESLVSDLRDESGEPDEATRARLSDALAAADRAYQEHRPAEHGKVA